MATNQNPKQLADTTQVLGPSLPPEGQQVDPPSGLREPRLFLIIDDPWEGKALIAAERVGEIFQEVYKDEMSPEYQEWLDGSSVGLVTSSKHIDSIKSLMLPACKQYTFLILKPTYVKEITWQQASSLGFHAFQRAIYGNE